MTNQSNFNLSRIIFLMVLALVCTAMIAAFLFYQASQPPELGAFPPVATALENLMKRDAAKGNQAARGLDEVESEYDSSHVRFGDRDEFPVLDKPEMSSIANADSFIDGNEPVIGVVIAGEAKAYPISAMGKHELINDVCGDVEIAVSWCPKSQTAIVFNRNVDEDDTLSFSHNGTHYRDSTILYDRRTESLWLHATGQCIKGIRRSQQLHFIPSRITSWQLWKTQNSETTVLNGPKASGPAGTYALGKDDDQQEFGVSIGQGKDTKFFSLAALDNQRVVHDRLANTDIVVCFDADGRFATAWENPVARISWDKQEKKFKDDGGIAWDHLHGKPLESEDAQPLKQIAATIWLSSHWKNFYAAPTSEETPANED